MDTFMTRKKFGRTALAVGIAVLFVGLVLLFSAPSFWTLLTLGLSMVINTIGLSALLMK
jgi:hypothetical protein